MPQITIDYQEYLHLLECKAKKDSLKTVIQVKDSSTVLLLSNVENMNEEQIKQFIYNVENNYKQRIFQHESTIMDLRVDNAYLLSAKDDLEKIPNWIKRIFI